MGLNLARVSVEMIIVPAAAAAATLTTTTANGVQHVGRKEKSDGI